jgi:putative membrane protein
MSRTKRDYLLLGLKGIAMGAGEFIPGFSAASVALISGIYKEFLDAVRGLNFNSLKVLFRKGFKEFWKKINGNFLLIIFGSIFIGILSFILLISYLYKAFPISLFSFLFGVIIASLIYFFKDFKEWNIKPIISITIGIGINVGLTFLNPLEMSRESEYWIIFACAFISGLVVYLPGVSVALIYILIGQYEFILKSISSFKTDFILIYLGGFLLSFLIFSRLFSWLLNKYHAISAPLLSGLLIGSLYKLWPWKNTLLAYVNQFAQDIPRKQENVLPNIYFEKTLKDPQTLYAILMVITGFLVVYLLHNTFSKKPEPDE